MANKVSNVLSAILAVPLHDETMKAALLARTAGIDGEELRRVVKAARESVPRHRHEADASQLVLFE
jgi:hypothetical protein